MVSGILRPNLGDDESNTAVSFISANHFCTVSVPLVSDFSSPLTANRYPFKGIDLSLVVGTGDFDVVFRKTVHHAFVVLGLP